MKVRVIASTTLDYDHDDPWVFTTQVENLGMELDESAKDGEHLIEFSGRGCYKSKHKPNAATRANGDYIANIIRQRHLSVLEHASVSFWVEGVSRSLTHELIRHRHFSFSQESQRFVTYASDTDPVYHPAYDNDVEARRVLKDLWQRALVEYNWLYDHFREKGLTRKQSAEAAREVLPNACPTSLVVTGNFRAWYEFMPKRNSPSADAQIQKFAQETLGHLQRIAPSVFNEFED